MLDPKEPTTWGAAGAAIIAAVFWLRHWMRRDKEDQATSGLSVTLTTASQNVIKMLEKKINDLVIEVHKLRDEVTKLLQQNHECESKNLQLTNQISDLNKRVSVVEKEVK